MLANKRFKLSTSTIAIDSNDGKRVAVTIPAGSTVTVISGLQHGDRMIDVTFDGRVVAIFAVDLDNRGVEIGKTRA